MLPIMTSHSPLRNWRTHTWYRMGCVRSWSSYQHPTLWMLARFGATVMLVGPGRRPPSAGRSRRASLPASPGETEPCPWGGCPARVWSPAPGQGQSSSRPLGTFACSCASPLVGGEWEGSGLEGFALLAGILGTPVATVTHDLLPLLHVTQGVTRFLLGELDDE